MNCMQNLVLILTEFCWEFVHVCFAHHSVKNVYANSPYTLNSIPFNSSGLHSKYGNCSVGAIFSERCTLAGDNTIFEVLCSHQYNVEVKDCAICIS